MKPFLLALLFLGGILFAEVPPSTELQELSACTEKLSAMKSAYELNLLRRVLARFEPRLGNMIRGSDIVQQNARHLQSLIEKPDFDPKLNHLIANAAVGCENYRMQLLRYVRRTVAFGTALLLTIGSLLGYYCYLSRELLAGSPRD